MTVAVVIPVWDAYVRWLPEAVASVRSQGGYDVIVVDNASQVAVPELEGTAVVRTERRLSTGAARNLGLAAVRAPLVVFLDADDVMLPGSLDALVAGIAADPGAAAFAMAIVDGDTGERHRSPRRVARALARAPIVFAFANSVWSLLPTQGATIMRSAEVRAVGGYADRDHGEDWALGASLAWRGRVRFAREPALVYRWREDSPGRAGATTVSKVLRSNAACVRARMRRDVNVPRLVRRAIPVVAVLQWTFALAVRPPFRALRRIKLAARIE